MPHRMGPVTYTPLPCLLCQYQIPTRSQMQPTSEPEHKRQPPQKCVEEWSPKGAVRVPTAGREHPILKEIYHCHKTVARELGPTGLDDLIWGRAPGWDPFLRQAPPQPQGPGHKGAVLLAVKKVVSTTPRQRWHNDCA